MIASIKSGIVASTLTILAAGGAHAQYAPMNMDWMIQSQMQNQQVGNAMANAYAWEYYRQLQMQRSMGYQGPAVPNGPYLRRNHCSNEYDYGSRRYYTVCR